MLRKIKVYGERNSGTNVLSEALRINFECTFLPHSGRLSVPVLTAILDDRGLEGPNRLLFGEALLDDSVKYHLRDDLGWKHGCPPLEAIREHPEREKLLFVVTTKHPYSWILSFQRRPYHRMYWEALDFSEFIRHYWITSRREQMPSLLKTPIDLYNVKLKSYIKLQRLCQELGLRFVHLRYEDFLYQFESSMERFCAHLKRTSSDWHYPDESTKMDELTFADYQEKYQPEKILAEIAQDDLDYINRKLQAEVIEHWGYSLHTR